MKRKQIQKWIFFVVLICGLANLFGYMTYVHSQSYNAMAVRINGSRTDTDNEPDATQLSAAVFHEERNKYMTNSYDNNDSVNITTKTYVQYKSNAHDNLNSIQHSLKSRSSSNSVTNNNVKPTRSRSVSHRTKIAHFNGVLNTDLGYIHNNIKICNSQLHIDMVIGVTSAVPNIRRRAVIRETWGAYRNAKVKLIFIVGRGNASVQRQIEAESLRHGDVVQRDFRDTYRNLTLKSSALFEWVTHFCNQSSFVLKADDDMFVNIPSLVHKLKEQNKRWGPKFFYCYFLKKSSPFRSKDSKWYTTMQDYGR
ncbi:lactosylceramide 1,3-N-acetyl-beta-D-glucosaminyltransferase A-like [Tubulanus polymorphus]|uniref:lactosylceramide 1,3-N-acetyl-beta-D-glucosaminyltransferase A-like n=1 Tax=Tubulanus polymorphus TaxID=672921 RepID=UPI003DA33539